MSTLMIQIILINADNVVQTRENQRNQCFFSVRGKFAGRWPCARLRPARMQQVSPPP